MCRERKFERKLHCHEGEDNEGDEREAIGCSRIAIRLFFTTAITDTDKAQA